MKYLTPKETAVLLRCSVHTVYRLLPRLAVHRRPSRDTLKVSGRSRLLIERESVERMLSGYPTHPSSVTAVVNRVLVKYGIDPAA